MCPLSPLFGLALVCCLHLVPSPTGAADWPQWCGPDLSGSSPDKGFAKTWSATEGVRWKTPLPGFSGETPAVSGERIFASSPNADKELLLLCVNRRAGKVPWQKALSAGDTTKCKTSPTATDGHVYGISERGTVVLVNAAPGALVHTAEMGGGSPTRSCMVLSAGDILLRTA